MFIVCYQALKDLEDRLAAPDPVVEEKVCIFEQGSKFTLNSFK